MKFKTITTIAIAALIIVACKAKKSTTATATTTPAPTTTSTETPSVNVAAKPASGIYAPGKIELAAIQAVHSDATMEKLTEGYELYTKGACVNCHGAKNIYKRSEGAWKDIIDDMAAKAHISDSQKDAVYKYVLAIKATQPKEAK